MLIVEHNVEMVTCADYRDAELIRRIGAATALEVRATGISYAFAPCIAVRICTVQELMYLDQYIFEVEFCLTNG